MLYFSRLSNALVCIVIAGLVVAQRDCDGELLITGYHGLGLVALIAFVAACLNFRGAISAAYLCD